MKASANTLGALAGLAAAATVALGFLASGAIVQAQPAASDLGSNPFANDPAAPAAGRALFDGACSACHGTGAGGSERGPALASGNFQHGGADTDLFQTIRAQACIRARRCQPSPPCRRTMSGSWSPI